MSKRTQKPEPSVEATQPAPEVEIRAIRLTDYVSPSRATTHDDLRLKEAIYASLQRVCDMTMAFVDEKLSEGFSLPEILQLYELVAPVVPTVTEENGRLRVCMDVTIMEKESGE
jgi:hypothetical protein